MPKIPVRLRVLAGRTKRALSPRYQFHTRYDAAPFSTRPTSLFDPATAPRTGEPLHLTHLAMFGRNAGDRLLPVAVRDLIASQMPGPTTWTARHVHGEVDERRLALVNASDGLVVGGGGLFLSDTNPNNVSGWQWPVSIEALRRIQVPFALFAVGYNRFRDQPDFGPRFAESVQEVAARSVFVGLRNHGSLRALEGYLPAELHAKLRYQPCPTTLLRLLYPTLVGAAGEGPADDDRPISLNCAFDRAELRFGEDRDRILGEVALAMRDLSRDHPIAYYAHAKGDEAMLPHLDRHGVPYRLHRLYRATPAEVVAAYRAPLVALGMRGHAQMIPFGCGRPIVSLASHDKLWYFLQDTGLEDLGVEVSGPGTREALTARVEAVVGDLVGTTARLDAARDQLWQVTARNVADLRAALTA